MTNKTALSILREDTKREAERLKARNGVLAAHARTLNAIHSKLLKVHATTPGANNFRLYAYSCGFAHYVYFQLDIDKLASLKDDVLIKALTRIEVAAGVEFRNSWDNNYGALPSRKFTANTLLVNDSGPTLNLEVSVQATVATEGPGCRRVKIGEKVRVEDVFEIQCE